MSRKKAISLVMVILMLVSLFTGLAAETKTTQAEDLNSGLVLHLKFDGDMTDSSGLGNNAECTYGKITYEDGIFGQSAVFNGKSYMEIEDDNSLDLNNFTISIWAYKSKNMKMDAAVPYVYKGEDEECWAPPYQIYENGDNMPFIFLHDDSDGSEMNQFTVYGNSIDIRKWFLLTATYDGSEVRMYEDGVLTKKVSVTGIPTNTLGKFYIGMKDGKYFFNGKMDDLRIYDRGLSAQEVAALYNNGLAENPKLLTQKDAMVAHLKFNTDFKDASAFGNDAKLVTGKVRFIDGVNGKAAKFSNGTYLEVLDNESIEFDQGFTMTSWVNLYKGSEIQTLLNKNGVSTSDISDDFAYKIRLYEDSCEFGYVPFGSQPTELCEKYGFDRSLVNKWVHIAVTFDTEEIRWYYNGMLVHKEEVSDYEGSSMAHSSGNLMIGSDGECFFNGAIDELKLYNYALSANQVKADAKNIDSIYISADNQNSIKAMTPNTTLTLETIRKCIDTGMNLNLISGVTYKSSNNKVFTVNKSGVIKAVKRGTAKLTVSHGGLTKTYKVMVK